MNASPGHVAVAIFGDGSELQGPAVPDGLVSVSLSSYGPGPFCKNRTPGAAVTFNTPKGAHSVWMIDADAEEPRWPTHIEIREGP